MNRLGIVALMLGASLGAAESKSLGECRSINDKADRLDCYDRLTDAPVEAIGDVGQVSATAPKKRDLSGFYLGATVGLGTSSKIERGANDRSVIFSSGEEFRASSPTIGVTGGYNAVSRNTLFGVQLDITGDLTAKKRSESNPEYSYEFPRQNGWSRWSHGRPVGTVEAYEYPSGTRLSAGRSFYNYKEQIAPTISVRIGRQFDNLLVYGRVGTGLARIKETFGYDDSKSIYCGSTTSETRYITADTAEYWTTACNNPYSGSITSTSRNITRPTATLAVGSEYHFDRYFTRLEGEMRHTFLDEQLDFGPSTGLTQYKVTTGIGIRF